MSALSKYLINFKYVWNWRKPVLMLRMAKRAFEILIQKKRPLRYVDLSIGNKCNMNCQHCFNKTQEKSYSSFIQTSPKKEFIEKRISPDYYAKIAKQAMNLGAVNFSFQGGEPLVYSDLRAYINAAKPYKNIISVTTNGLILDIAKAKELKSWGVDIVTISIDEFRTQEAITAAQVAVDNAISAGLKVTVGTVVSKTTIRNPFLIELIQFCKKRGIICLLIYAVPEGGLWDKPSELLEDEDIELINKIKDVAGPLVRTDFDANWVERGCGAGKEIIYIKADGETYSCPFIPISFGNVGRHSLNFIRNKMLDTEMLKTYQPKCLAGEGRGLWRQFV